MRKISVAEAYRISIHLLQVVTLLLIYSISALAKNNCDTNTSQVNPATFIQSGIGGTGIGECSVNTLAQNNCDTNASPAIPTQSGIGGTGAPQSGIGDTGIHLEGTSNQEGGIGGTGSVANDGGIGGTGIIGVITGFASICVNGVEIHYDANTPVSVDGRLSTARDLAVGQIIAARALGTGHELTARNIAIIHAAVGPISSLNHETGKMHVLGQTIQIERSKDHNNFAYLKTGDWVQVSGHRLSNGMIVASRIEVTPPLAESKINGYVNHIDTKGFEVNGTRINHEAKLLPAGIAQGMEVLVVGHWDGAHLKARHIQTEPTRQSMGTVEHIVIEGYIHALDGEKLNVSNRIVTLDSNTPIATGNTKDDFRLDQRIQVNGRLDANQRIIVEHVELKHELPIQIQEKIDRNQINSNKDKKTDSSDSGSGSKDSSEDKQKSELSGKDNKNNFGNESGTSSTKENGSNQSGHSNDRKDTLKKEINNSVDKNHSSESGSSSRDSSDSLKDIGKSDSSSLSGHEQKENSHDIHQQNSDILSDQRNIGKPEKPDGSDSTDRPSDHRDNNLRDIDIPDRVRDHSGHQDRHLDR